MFAKGGREQKREREQERARERWEQAGNVSDFFSCTYTQLVRIISINLQRAQSRPPPKHALAPLSRASPGDFLIWEAPLQGELKLVPSAPLSQRTGALVPVYYTGLRLLWAHTSASLGGGEGAGTVGTDLT